MKITRIPEQDLQALEKLAALSEQEAAFFSEAIAKTEPAIGRASFLHETTKSLPKMDKVVIEGLVRTLLGMQATRIAWEATVEDFVAALEFAENVLNSRVLAESVELWRGRLLGLLRLQSLFLSAKAATVLSAQEHPFVAAKIYTDIRPIFTDDGHAASQLDASAGVLVHMLHLQLGGENQPQEIYVALDNRDIETLAKVLSRAKAKTAKLTQTIQRSGMRYLEPPQE